MKYIIDSLSHPTLSGKWFDSDLDSSFESLNAQLVNNDITYSCAVGINGVEGYNHKDFITQCNKFDRLIPIAGVDIHVIDIVKELAEIKELGFKGVKLHPRFCSFDLVSNFDELVTIIDICHELNLVVFFCTFYSAKIDDMPDTDPYWDLVKVLKAAKKAKIVLLHGGTIRLMQYADLVKFNENLLLDVSYTLMKYQESSLDNDLKYLFKTLDQRMCIGADHPEYDYKSVIKRVDDLTEGLEKNKVKNIFFNNLNSFL